MDHLPAATLVTGSARAATCAAVRASDTAFGTVCLSLITAVTVFASTPTAATNLTSRVAPLPLC